MPPIRKLVQLSIAAALLACFALPAASAPAQRADWVSGQVVVRFKHDTGAAARDAVRRGVGARLGRRMGLRDHEILLVGRGRTRSVARQLSHDPRVVVAEPNFIYRTAACPIAQTSGRCRPNDPNFGFEYGLNNTGQFVGNRNGTPDGDIDALEAWDMTVGSPSVTVAIVDTGIDYNQPDLAPQIWKNAGEMGTDAQGRDKRSNNVDDDGNGYVDDWRGWDVVGRKIGGTPDSDNDPMDLRGHGTHVAGIVGAVGNNAFGAVGVNWRVKLMAVRAQGSRSQMTMADVAEAFAYAANNGARIANASIASDEESQILDRVVTDHPNTLYVIAANNRSKDLDQPGNTAYPCEAKNANDPSQRAPNVVCVAATDNRDILASWFTNYGAKSVDLAAPGNAVYSTQPPFQTVWTESWETNPFTSSPPRWATGAASGSTSRWGQTTDNHTAGSWALGDSPGNSYAPHSNTWVQNASPINLAGQQGCRLEESIRVFTDPGDGFYIQARRDTAFGPVTNQYDEDHLANFGDMMGFFGGDISTTKRTDVSDFDGGPLYLRQGLLAPGSNPGGKTGVNLDNLRVNCLGSTYSADGKREIESESGTSMATPHVAGVAALILARFPNATTQQIKDKLLRSVDVKSTLVGKTVTGGRVNAYKALAETTAAVTGGVLQVIAGSGERNNLKVTPFTENGVSKYRVDDAYFAGEPASGSRIVPGAGCTRTAETQAVCAGATSYVLDDDDLDGPAEDTVPNTTISDGPAASTSATSASFTFAADETGVTFQCRLDGGAWAACTSPRSVTVGNGTHSFEARGGAELTPARWTWTVSGAGPPPPDVPPAAPTGLKATAGDAQVGLDWADNGEADLAGYNVYRATTAGGPYTKRNATLLSTSAYNDTGLTNGTKYFYVVRAADKGSHESASSAEVSATPTGGAPPPPPPPPGGGPYRQAVLGTSGVLSYWRLGEAAGASLAADEIGGRPGVYEGNPALGQPGALKGDTNTSLGLDGVDDRVTVPDSDALHTSSVTVEGWARSTTSAWTGSGWIASKRSTFILSPTAGNRTVTWYVQQAGTTGFKSVYFAPASITGWHHYVGTYDAATGTMGLYVDGAQVATKAAAAAPLLTSTTPLTLGSDQASLKRFGRGGLDEVAIYNRALDAATISQHYKAGTGT